MKKDFFKITAASVFSFAVITAFYIIFVIIYRRKQYKYWYETDDIK